MAQEEQLISLLSSYPSLSFIDAFLASHPEARLYLVGGAVRDTLIGRRMREIDFDFVVTGLASQGLEAWLREQGEVNLVGQHFGVFKFMPKGYASRNTEFVDIALPRTEAVTTGSLGGYKDFDIQSDPNLPIEDDLARRDFTINAMAWDVREKKLIDPFDGQADLSRKMIRAVGSPPERFAEDLSRILRGIRFAAELDFVIEEKTGQAMKELLPQLNSQKEVDGTFHYVVPRETLGGELAKALSRNPHRAIKEFQNHHALRELFPGVQTLVQDDSKYLEPLSSATPGELTIVLTLLLRDLSLEDVHKTLSSVGLDTLARGSSQRTEAELIAALVRLWQEHLDTEGIRTMRANEFEKRYFNGKGLLFLRCLELLDSTDLRTAIQARRASIESRWLVDHDEPIAPLLSGQDILAKGIPAGPDVRIWLDRVRDLQLDGVLMRREDALHWLSTELKQKSPI